MAKAVKVVDVAEAKKVAVVLRVLDEEKSIIVRGSGLPDIIIRSDKSAEWLVKQGFKIGDIKIVGNKPSNWDEVFNVHSA